MSALRFMIAVVDGDNFFLKVDTDRPAHQLEAGTAADALNKRSERGEAWPRYGVQSQAWGSSGNLVPGTALWSPPPDHFFEADYVYTVNGFEVGRQYRWVLGDSYLLSTGRTRTIVPQPAGTLLTEAGTFTATQTAYYLWRASPMSDPPDAGLRVRARLMPSPRNPVGFARFSDPAGSDNLVLLTDDWRGASGEDGGRGRAWRMRAGQAAQEIPLNGHDVWGTSRLVPCFNGLTLIRQGNERHYFHAAALDISTSRIQLNCAATWADGDAVYFWADEDSYITGASGPQAGTIYFVKNIAGDKVELYTSEALTTKLVMDIEAVGQFYLERRAEMPGFYGNGPPPLLMQPDATQTAFQAGFDAVPPRVLVTAQDATSKVIDAANHRLIPGDSISFVHSGTGTTFYVDVKSDHALTFHTSVDLALAGSTPQTVTITAGDYLKKTGASGLAMPPAREGLYTKNNRLILVNGRNNLANSDPLDPLHFTPFLASVTANLGESDEVTALVELGEDAVLVAKTGKLHVLTSYSQGPSAWRLGNVTGEYGIIAPLSAISIGKDVWGLSRKGVVSVRQTEQGEILGVALPMSQPMKAYLDNVDWTHANQACAATWNNRYFLAVPLKGQSGSGVVVKNNGVLVYNFLTQGWEGLWMGDTLQVYAWARHNLYGEERLTFVDYDGVVSWLSDAWTDADLAIADRLVTRMYLGQGTGPDTPKLWLRGALVLNHQYANVTVTAVAPGHNEEQQVLSKAYDATRYLVRGPAAYDPVDSATRFDEAHREDYSATPEELLDAQLDVHQNITESLRMRVNDWGVQLRIENARGSCRISSVSLAGRATGRVAGRAA